MIDTNTYKDLLEKDLAKTRAQIKELEKTDPANDNTRGLDNQLDSDYDESELGFRTNELLEQNTKHEHEILRALQRIEEGSYGTCGNCKEEINTDRLDVLPWTDTCISCEQ